MIRRRRSPPRCTVCRVRKLRAVIRKGVPGSDMPPWKRLGEAAITGLADYVLELASEEP